MKRSTFTFTFFGLALALVVAATSGAGAAQRPLGTAGARANKASGAAGLTIRWDIISYDFTTRPVPVSAGGQASARTGDKSSITLTGSGTFGGAPTNDTGGGTWTTFDPTGGVTGSGAYTVKALVSFFAAPGTFGSFAGLYELADQIGDSADAHAGLAVLRISYSDGSQGTLTLSSRQAGTPPTLFMGSTATKGFGAFWLPEPARGGVDGNRTVFHVVR